MSIITITAKVPAKSVSNDRELVYAGCSFYAELKWIKMNVNDPEPVTDSHPRALYHLEIASSTGTFSYFPPPLEDELTQVSFTTPDADQHLSEVFENLHEKIAESHTYDSLEQAAFNEAESAALRRIDELEGMLVRCRTVLRNMALENQSWSRFVKRWEISDEPLRNDAKNLLPLIQKLLD